MDLDGWMLCRWQECRSPCTWTMMTVATSTRAAAAAAAASAPLKAVVVVLAATAPPRRMRSWACSATATSTSRPPSNKRAKATSCRWVSRQTAVAATRFTLSHLCTCFALICSCLLVFAGEPGGFSLRLERRLRSADLKLVVACVSGVEALLDDDSTKFKILHPTIPAASAASGGHATAAPSSSQLSVSLSQRPPPPPAPRADSYLQQSSLMRLLLLNEKLQPKLIEMLIERLSSMTKENKAPGTEDKSVAAQAHSSCRHMRAIHARVPVR